MQTLPIITNTEKIIREIIPQKDLLNQAFWLFFHIKDGEGVEWMDYDLPIPTFLKHINRGYLVGWAIDGYFGTKKGQKFLGDILARFLVTFKKDNIERLAYKPQIDDKTAHIHAKVYKLREFSRKLASIPTKIYIPERAQQFHDYAFWAIKFYAEDMINETGLIAYENLENWALEQFVDKERSTIRAKCRSVFYWYENKDFIIPKKHRPMKQYLEETVASRSEHMRNVSKKKAEKNKKIVINAITGLYADEYKKKSGAWHFTKISEATGISSKTVAKIIKEYENQTNT